MRGTKLGNLCRKFSGRRKGGLWGLIRENLRGEKSDQGKNRGKNIVNPCKDEKGRV